MRDEPWNTNKHTSAEDLIARIKASVERRTEPPSGAVVSSDLSAEPVSAPDRAGAGETPVNRILLESLELIAHHLGCLQAQLGLLEGWVGEDAELSAQLSHDLSISIGEQSVHLADLEARLSAVEARSAAPRSTNGCGLAQPAASGRLSHRLFRALAPAVARIEEVVAPMPSNRPAVIQSQEPAAAIGPAIARPASATRPRWPDGHFCSPVVNVEDVWQRQSEIWPADPQLLGVDFNHDRQREFVTAEFGKYLVDYDYPDEPPPDGQDNQFYSNNAMFGLLDSRALFVMLRVLHPKRMIEVGSGFSSLLTADVNCRFLEGSLDFTCIEPFPPQMLTDGVKGISRLIRRQVQDVPLSVFEQLDKDDVLFIDSSHVAKTGSDVNHLVFEVLPRLRSGVVIHFHDIPFPHEYPKEWVLTESRSWNELYVVRALLMFTDAFEFLFGSSYAMHHFWETLEPLVGREAMGGGSVWLRRTETSLNGSNARP